MTKTLNFSLLKVAPESTPFQRTPRLKHDNPLGTVHDGWFATLPDSAIGCAFHTQNPVDRVHITAALSANIVQLAPQKMDRFGRLNSAALRQAIGDRQGRLVPLDGKLYARATTKCIVFKWFT